MSDAADHAQIEPTKFRVGPVDVDGTTLRLHFSAPDGTPFTEVIELPGPVDAASAAVASLLRMLSTAVSLSYFKAFAPATLVVPGGLTASEARFATEVTRQGLGEFAYVNSLPAVLTTEVVAPELDAVPTAAPGARTAPRRVLVAVGGGKDSIVSIEALRRTGVEVGLFAVNSYDPIEATARVAGLPLHVARRRIDPAIIERNAAGAPNGHVPVTAVNSLVAELTAVALGYDTVVFSNEASSSYGNVVWQDRLINHQWSKGLEFEGILRDALPAGAPDYVSLLRPLTELRIARRFATLTDYHRAFTSCNRAFKLNEADRTSWCGDCPKCRFVFLCLAPFLPRAALLDIFGGRDLFADESQVDGFLELLGVDGTLKPFECVGQPDECRVALGLVRDHPDWVGHPFLAEPRVAAVVTPEWEADTVFAFGDEHFLPPELEAVARAI